MTPRFVKSLKFDWCHQSRPPCSGYSGGSRSETAECLARVDLLGSQQDPPQGKHFEKLADHVCHLLHLYHFLPRSPLCYQKLALGRHKDVFRASHQLLPFALPIRRAILLAFRHRVFLRALNFVLK